MLRDIGSMPWTTGNPVTLCDNSLEYVMPAGIVLFAKVVFFNEYSNFLSYVLNTI